MKQLPTSGLHRALGVGPVLTQQAGSLQETFLNTENVVSDSVMEDRRVEVGLNMSRAV